MNWVAIVKVMAEEDYMTRPVAVTLLGKGCSLWQFNSKFNSNDMENLVENHFCTNHRIFILQFTHQNSKCFDQRRRGCLNGVVIFQAQSQTNYFNQLRS